jgi:NADH-quinone oxidoreductase subunit D
MKMEELSILNLVLLTLPRTGIFQNVLLMDGERILEAEPTITYTALLKFTEN